MQSRRTYTPAPLVRWPPKRATCRDIPLPTYGGSIKSDLNRDSARGGSRARGITSEIASSWFARIAGTKRRLRSRSASSHAIHRFLRHRGPRATRYRSPSNARATSLEEDRLHDGGGSRSPEPIRLEATSSWSTTGRVQDSSHSRSLQITRLGEF